MITFSIYDYILFVLYFGAVLYIGFRARSSNNSKLDYLVAGRKLTLPAFIATIVSTFYGGILGIGEFTYNYGLSSWFLNAFPYYVFILIFALFMAKKVRKSELFTIPDKLQLAYGKNVSVLGAVFVFFLVTPAPYILMLGILVQLLFGFSLIISMVIVMALSVAFLFKGGLKADVQVNILEFILMFAGFGIILPFCFIKLGGISYLTQNLPAEHLTLTGGNSLQFILVWFFIGAWAVVDPSFHQRCYAAKDESVAKNGVLISLIFWFIFDFMTTTAGLYARAHISNLENPAMSYPLLAQDILPSAAKGLFFIGMAATIMSTLHSLVFISGSTFGRDIIGKIKNIPDANNFYTKIGIALSAVISILIVLWIPSVVNIWYSIGSLIIPALLISVVSSYFGSLVIKKEYIFIAMLASFGISLACFLYGQNNIIEGNAVYPMDLEPMYPGLFGGIAVYLAGFFMKTAKLKVKEI